MEPSKEAIAVRVTRLNRQIVGKVTGGTNKFNKKTLDREALLDALTVLYDECNEDPIKKCDDLVKTFVDKYRSTLADLKRTRVCLSDFDMLQVIGRGHFGEVHMVREKQTGDVYALKSMRKEQARRRIGLEDEREVLEVAAGPWTTKLQYAFQDSNSLYLVMELCSGGDLAGMLARRNHPLSERDAAFYIAEVTHALKALHGLGYVHRDVKPHNIFLDRCGHVKLGDLGSVARLNEHACGAGGAGRASGAGGGAAGGTLDYAAPELLAADGHSVCLEYCARVHSTAISACDYWSLGVVAFELVTLRRPFSTGDDDSAAQILANIQRYESSECPEPPFEPPPAGPGPEWRSLVCGLLRAAPGKRYNYLDTLQHPAMAHLCMHAIRDQPPPWVPCVRGAEDARYFRPAPRLVPPPDAAPFRARAPFAGQLPFIGYSFVAPDDSEEHASTSGFNASHDCTAIDMATFKSAEKIAAMRAKEIASLQSRLAAAEGQAGAGAAAEKARRAAEDEAERIRAKLQAEITALSLQNKRLERQIEIEKEERMALERSNQQLQTNISERTNTELRSAIAERDEAMCERDGLRQNLRRMEERVAELQAECTRAMAAAETARAQQRHYKEIIEHAHDLRHRRLTEINVRAIDTVAKERAIRRQTLSGGEAESREAGARLATAEANVAKETRARELADKRVATLEAETDALRREIEHGKRDLAKAQESINEKRRHVDSSTDRMTELQAQLTQERIKVTTLETQVQTLEKAIREASVREAALEQQCARTEARLTERLQAAAACALQDDARAREKMTALEQLVRQLEREVSALEQRTCTNCAERANETECDQAARERGTKDAHSDTESVGEVATAQVSVLKEQLERAEAQLQARADEIAALRQEARTANLARWRKEREFNDLTNEMKAKARDTKRLEERLTNALEARKISEQKADKLQIELAALRPQYEHASKELEQCKEQLAKLQKVYDTAQTEVDRSRNDIRKLKSELQYSEKRRLHAEEQEELSSRERAQLRDELQELRASNHDLVLNNKTLQEACSLLEDQLSDLEKLTDIHELKTKDLESERTRLRIELDNCRSRLEAAERAAHCHSTSAATATVQGEAAAAQAKHAHCQLQLLRERLESREARVAELEARLADAEAERAAGAAAVSSAARRVRDLQEECAALRTRAHAHHAAALQLQARCEEAQEELAAAQEAREAATAWWRTRETKADATLRQQAKLIDFLQAKVEEAGRKKCSLSNKLFGRSGRRNTASPPLRRVNRELREEVERLRAKLAANNVEPTYLTTPKREKSKPLINGSIKGIDTPDAAQDDNMLQIVWSDGSIDRVRVRDSESGMVIPHGGRDSRATLASTAVRSLPPYEGQRAFSVKLDNSDREAIVICPNLTSRAQWLSRLRAAPAPAPAPAPALNPAYSPAPLVTLSALPTAALYVANNVLAIGSTEGLHSLRGAIRIEFEAEMSPPRVANMAGVAGLAAAGGRVLLLSAGSLLHANLRALSSTLRRASNLRPTLTVSRVALPDNTHPQMIKAMSGATGGAAAACGRRVLLIQPSGADLKVSRSLTVDRAPHALLPTPRALYIASERLLSLPLPAGAVEAFAANVPIVAAAARRHSAPKALLLVRDEPLEILVCYAECGVFLDENGRRTRSEDPKWSVAVKAFEFVQPCLYVASDDKITVIYVSEDAYMSPPCTCDTASLASGGSEFYAPQTIDVTLKEPMILGTTPTGVIIRSRTTDGYNVSVLEGVAAFKSIGASIESLATAPGSRRESADLAQSLTDLHNRGDLNTSSPRCSDASHIPDTPRDLSSDSVESTTGFLADIRKKARQLRNKNRKEQSPEDVIKEILTTEVGLKRPSIGRKSPAIISDSESDSEPEETESSKRTADLCAEMFARQVRFQ